MRLDPNFILQSLGEEAFLIPIGEKSDSFHGVIRLNVTARCIALGLQNGATREELIRALDRAYEGTEEQFERAVDYTIEALRQANAIIE